MKRLHVISFDNPYPPNYGGVIDVYYKIKALHDLGVKVILHAFEYGRVPTTELNKICEKVYYYERRTFVNPFYGSLPYIVSTRDNKELLKRLQKDTLPILFEGLHTCFFLNHISLRSRTTIVRMHNIEHEYYNRLARVESNLFKRYFFIREAARLKDYERMLEYADKILAISPNDLEYLGNKFTKVDYLPAFHPNDEVTAITGKGDYLFYHGKLSVGENDEAARFLVSEVFSKQRMPCYIAGDKASIQLKKLAEAYPNVSILEHLPTEKIADLVRNAHINVLPTFQNTGIKLKLINVLYQGRFVIANDEMVANTGCESLCTIANSPSEFVERIYDLQPQSFTEQNLRERKEILGQLFDNRSNAKKLMEWL